MFYMSLATVSVGTSSSFKHVTYTMFILLQFVAVLIFYRGFMLLHDVQFSTLRKGGLHVFTEDLSKKSQL